MVIKYFLVFSLVFLVYLFQKVIIKAETSMKVRQFSYIIYHVINSN